MKRLFALMLILITWTSFVYAQGKYAMAVGEVQSAGSKITKVGNITLTFGAAGDDDFLAASDGTVIDGYLAYTKGNNKSASPKKFPTEGTFYTFDVKKTGTLEVGIVQDIGDGKYFCVLEDGVEMPSPYSGINVTEKYYGTRSFPVKKDKQYIVYGVGTKLGFYGFNFTIDNDAPENIEPEPEDNSLSAYDANKPLGWAESVTGSENQNMVTVTNAFDLEEQLESEGAKTIYLKGTITVSSMIDVLGAKNKTVYGIDNATIYNDQKDPENPNATGGLQLKECDNVIIRNVTFKGAGAYDIEGQDNLFLKGSTNIWIDHCDFLDGIDGNFDCSNGSDNVCVSWCRFRYTMPSETEGMTGDGSGEHRFSNLWGGNDYDTGNFNKLNTTFVSCWWDKGCVERMPRVRDGKVHLVNCYWSSPDTKYCIGVGTYAQLFVENSVFQIPSNKKTYAFKGADYSLTIKGCVGQEDYEEIAGKPQFMPPYSLTPYSVDNVVKAVTAAKGGAGATLDISENGLPVKQATAIHEVNLPQETPAQFDVYTISGMKIRSKAISLDGLPQGVYIVSGKKIFIK